MTIPASTYQPQQRVCVYAFKERLGYEEVQELCLPAFFCMSTIFIIISIDNYYFSIRSLVVSLDKTRSKKFNLYIFTQLFHKIMNYQANDQNIALVLSELDQIITKNYKQQIENYQKCVIPFETKRINQNLNLTSKNVSLQRDKRQLTRKIQKMLGQNQRQQYVMEGQSFKISHLQHIVADLDKVNSQNLNIIQSMKQTAKQIQEQIGKKSEVLKNSQQQKKKVLKQYDDKNNQYNTLLSNYMKDKNYIAQKLNYMNQLQQQIFSKERKLKQEEAYLKKQWEQFQQSKKTRQRPKIFKKPTNQKVPQKQPEKKQKYQKDQILKNPVKKLVKYHTNQINDASINYSGNLLATCGGDRYIKIYDIANFQVVSSMQTHTESIPLCLSLNYTGERVLVGSSQKSMHLYSTSNGKQLHSFIGHGYKINSVSWSSQKQKCVSGSQDKQIKVWDIQKVTNLLSIQCGKAVKSLNCNNSQPIIYSGHSDGSVRLYSLNQGSSPIMQVKGIIDYSINSIVVLSNRNQLLVSSQEGSPIHLFDLKMNKSIAKFQGKDFFNTAAKAQLSPSQKYVVAGNCDGNIYYWQKDKQALSKRISGHDTGITVLRYHPITGYIVSCDKTGNVIIWQPNA